MITAGFTAFNNYLRSRLAQKPVFIPQPPPLGDPSGQVAESHRDRDNERRGGGPLDELVVSAAPKSEPAEIEELSVSGDRGTSGKRLDELVIEDAQQAGAKASQVGELLQTAGGLAKPGLVQEGVFQGAAHFVEKVGNWYSRLGLISSAASLAADPTTEKAVKVANTGFGEIATMGLGGLGRPAANVVGELGRAVPGSFQAAVSELQRVSFQDQDPEPWRVYEHTANLVSSPLGVEAGSLMSDFRREGSMSWSQLTEQHGVGAGTVRAIAYWALGDLQPQGSSAEGP